MTPSWGTHVIICLSKPIGDAAPRVALMSAVALRGQHGVSVASPAATDVPRSWDTVIIGGGVQGTWAPGTPLHFAPCFSVMEQAGRRQADATGSPSYAESKQRAR